MIDRFHLHAHCTGEDVLGWEKMNANHVSSRYQLSYLSHLFNSFEKTRKEHVITSKTVKLSIGHHLWNSLSQFQLIM